MTFEIFQIYLKVASFEVWKIMERLMKKQKYARPLMDILIITKTKVDMKPPLYGFLNTSHFTFSNSNLT